MDLKYNRWHLYDILKRHKPPTRKELINIENMDEKEIKEGTLEYLTVLSKDKYMQADKELKI